MIINEGSLKLKTKKFKRISKQMGVFYNPIMSLNRDISVLLLNSINKKNMQIADPLAASGVRSIRFLKELSKNKIKKIYINDIDKKAVKSIKENLILNKFNYKINKKISINNEDANLFLLNSSGFDYIDIDPFGSPNFLLDSSCRRLARDGILAVTATDTAALCGTALNACVRKYWAVPKKDALMHETGLRILIRKIQLVGAQYDKALVPIFSYSKAHYMRIFLKNEKGKNRVDEILQQFSFLNNVGPLWIGKLYDKELCDKMYKNALKNDFFKNDKELLKFLKVIKDESKINSVGFYDLHDICEKNKIKHLLKKDIIKKNIKRLGFKVSDTHFAGNGIRSNIPYQRLVNLLKNK